VTDQSAKEEATALFLEGTDQAEVPDVRGTPIPAAGDAIRNAGFHPLLGRRGLAPFSTHLHKPPPLVQGQNPPAGTVGKIGSTVTMYVTGNQLRPAGCSAAGCWKGLDAGLGGA